MPPMLDSNDPRSISDYVDQQVNPIAQAIQKAVAAQAEREAERVRDALIEANSKTFDKAQSYTTVIIAGAYVGMFSVWSSSKDALSSKGSTAIALCLTFSLTFFVLYEVLGIALRTFSFLRFRHELAGAKKIEDLASLIKQQQTREAKSGHFFIPLYALSLALTLLPALIASGLLIYNTAAKLVGWTSWPA